jgi:nitrite reductase/ring-hydroxylating ferredoxin subunit
VADKVLASRRVTELASGTPIGHPLHPLLVTIPIGSWTSSMIFDLTGDEKAADALIGIGVVSALPTAVAGVNDWRYTSGAEQRVGLVHAILNNVALGTYGLSWLARKAGRRKSGIVLSILGAGAITASGWLGGHLSYALGVGVDTTAFQHSEQDWTWVADLAEIQAGELSHSDIGGVPLVLTRDGDGVVALADRCTHRGGPLHEGEIRDGCIVCPLHGSMFSLDGTVAGGPATRPLPAYQVKITDGQVYARRVDEPRTFRTNPVGV